MTFVDGVGADAVEFCRCLYWSVRIEGPYFGVPRPDLHTDFDRARLPDSRAIARELSVQ